MLIQLNLLTLFIHEVMYFISQSNNIVGQAYLAVLLTNTAIYSILFLATRLLSLRALRKIRPIPTDHKNQFIATGVIKFSAWIGGLCYLAGSNIQPIIALNAADFHCDATCLHEVGDTSVMLLVIASLLFSINEIHSGKILILIRDMSGILATDDEDGHTEWPTWGRAAECIAFIRVFDSSFTTIASLSADSNYSCSRFEIGIVWSMYIILMLIWGVLLTVIMGPGLLSSWRKRSSVELIQKNIIKLAIFLATCSLLLGSNFQPLGCVLNCNIQSSNFTVDCNQSNFHATRMTMLFIAMLLISPLCFFMTVRWFCLTKEAGSLGFENILEMNTVTELQLHQDVTLLEFKNIAL